MVIRFSLGYYLARGLDPALHSKECISSKDNQLFTAMKVQVNLFFAVAFPADRSCDSLDFVASCSEQIVEIDSGFRPFFVSLCMVKTNGSSIATLRLLDASNPLCISFKFTCKAFDCIIWEEPNSLHRNLIPCVKHKGIMEVTPYLFRYSRNEIYCSLPYSWFTSKQYGCVHKCKQNSLLTGRPNALPGRGCMRRNASNFVAVNNYWVTSDNATVKKIPIFFNFIIRVNSSLTVKLGIIKVI